MTASMTRADSGTMSARNLRYLDDHFDRHIASGKLAGTITVVFHRDQITHWSAQGLRDRERGTPMTDDTIFRIYSMTKPIVSVALMQLYERGLFQLDDPVSKYIPSWQNLRVYAGGTYPNFQTTPCERPMTVRDLLSHQAGLTAPASDGTHVDAAYRQVGIGSKIGRTTVGSTLQDLVDALAELPLDYSPGTGWLYSSSVDIVGYLVEQLSGQRLDTYLQEHIFEPLGMTDSGFWVQPHQVNRLATNYRGVKGGGVEIVDDLEKSPYLTEPTFHSGSGGLVSTAGDYLRFSRMLLGKGTLDGQRIIGRKTLGLMAQNHITGGKTIAQAATAARWREVSRQGVGFGLGFAVALDSADSQVTDSPGSYYWAGAASTHFWIDPTEDLAVVFMTQYMSTLPETRLNIARELRAIVYGALD
ncbi:MAG: serine hydrolase domain-containing protein [Chloroflexota bacterium]